MNPRSVTSVLVLALISWAALAAPMAHAKKPVVPPTEAEIKAYCDSRLTRDVKVQGSCSYTVNDGLFRVCMNFIGHWIPDALIKIACSESDTGIQKTPCDTAGVSRICAHDPGGKIWAERVDYVPIPPDADADCVDEDYQVILCLYH